MSVLTDADVRRIVREELVPIRRELHKNDGSSIKRSVDQIESRLAAESLPELHDDPLKTVEARIELLDRSDHVGEHRSVFVNDLPESAVQRLADGVGSVDGLGEVGTDLAHGAPSTGDLAAASAVVGEASVGAAPGADSSGAPGASPEGVR